MFVYLSSLVILSLLIGSFVSAITYRIPRKIDFIYGRSFCDNCKMKLHWYDNIPLFSYIFYLGKSRCCNKKISFRYPLIEIATVVGFIFLYLSSLPPIYYILFTLCIMIFVIDLEHQIIPDELSWAILLLAIVTSSFLFTNIFAALLLSLSILFLHLITKGRGMGLGDVKLVLALGSWTGLEKGLYFLLYSFLTGGLFACILLILGKAKLKTKIAFGPFLLIGFWLVTLI